MSKMTRVFTTRCILHIVTHTKLDAQRDKLATVVARTELTTLAVDRRAVTKFSNSGV